MIPLAIPDLTGRELELLAECIRSTYVSSVGPFVDRFERMVATATGSEYAVAVSSGTAALHMALLAVGVTRDSLVIVPSFSFIASANAVAHAQAHPWFFDVTKESWTLDADQVARALAEQCHLVGGVPHLRESGQRIAAMLPVFAAGHPAKMQHIGEIGTKWNIPIVGDAAAAIGASLHEQPIGAFGDALALSFNGNKTVTCGGGGAVVTNSERIAQRVRHISTTARVGPGYRHDEVGFNLRMTNLQAAVGCAQIERLGALVSAKQRIHQTYREAFEPHGIASFVGASWAKSSNWMSGIVVPPEVGAADGVARALANEGVDAREFWVPLHLQSPYEGCRHSDLKVTNDIWSQLLTLPCSSSLSQPDQDFVIGATLKALRDLLPHG